ncbi:fumarylacetoacetate hydrolase family protein [Myxococcus sp. K15C18031901]|uniref:fumarylacetoacetate hydrolase family protein n=1 Tax=Myxococcus dinghuensis TaxID=2906761 RepID=UPI0020A7E8BE|nr:fumarylacetoacetate hydrolase family protein [Myxococcus dinghuensis]MCP3103388.1 fumarylacetoacetate hydrolase family protein [Myxococcus dinghuensis]
MALNVVRCAFEGRTRWGVLEKDQVALVPGEFATTGDFVTAMPVSRLSGLDGPRVPRSAITVLSPVTRNQRFVCQGANYRQHMIESGVDPDVKNFNMIFTKAPSCIVPADSDVVRPRRVRFLDYEVELGLVLRRDITGPETFTESNLLGVLAGLVIVNDYSARDIQIPEGQFHKGKSFRTFGPVGPHLCLLEPQDLPRLRALELELRVDGQVRQRDSTRNLVYGPAETLTELSSVQDLSAGDLLATGTPAGCALAVPSPLKQRLGALLPERKKWELFFAQQARRPYLQPGQLVEATIRSGDGAIDLGLQRNRVVQEA